MSPQKFSSYLRKPFELNAEAVTNLNQVVAEYPYFSNAWLLLARAEHNLKSPGFDTALKQASMYAGERKLLYKLVNIDEKELPGPTIAETLRTKLPVLPAAERETVFEAPYTPDAVALPGTHEEKPDPALEKTLTDAEKLASAYDEIFGTSTGATDEDLTVEFESFEPTVNTASNDAVREKPADEALPGITGNAAEEITTPVDELLTEDIYSSIIIDEEDDHELAPLFSIEEDELPKEDETNKVDILEAESGQPVDVAALEEISPAPDAEPAAHNDDPAPIIEAPIAEKATVAAEPAEEETGEIEVPIAFKLDKRETAPAEQDTRVQEEEKPVLVTPNTFFDWLAQLKKLQGTQEKKTELISIDASNARPTAGEEKKTAVTPVAEAKPAKKSSVDDIIDKFIQINPTISRPKAEFYNPALKSKVSDTPPDDLATETLAKIYLSQNLFERAIATYERLSELYPGKAATYREMIRDIENNLPN